MDLNTSHTDSPQAQLPLRDLGSFVYTPTVSDAEISGKHSSPSLHSFSFYTFCTAQGILTFSNKALKHHLTVYIPFVVQDKTAKTLNALLLLMLWFIV